MKRILMVTLLALSATLMVFAQGADRRDMGNRGNGTQRVPPVQTTVTGNLTVVNGMVAIKDGDTTYVIPGLLRYVGFIDGLKDGAQVKVEGTVRSRQADDKIKRLLAGKLTIGSKEYQLGDPSGKNRMHNNRQRPKQPGQPNNGNFRRQGPGQGQRPGAGCSCQTQQQNNQRGRNRR